ncbi:hypothetical protein K491DRAFT_718079 [Lophiostoma macrostomum CBS 122681]|uniref:F-box domain-containing protein n=1 Tax=Lophiostoma macrostomum CBS 122681 TaxID=1314788 RepID=A0A6A6T053_9PLEO|nr:hypothetical protein K491DRAFT_718079 [Lophiostoma macrostomum CBS 122681]
MSAPAGLPMELWLMIAFHLRSGETTDKASLLNLTFTSRWFRALATPFLYEQIDLNVKTVGKVWSTHKLWLFSRTILSTPDLGLHVRKVCTNEPTKFLYLNKFIELSVKECQGLSDQALAMLPDDIYGNRPGCYQSRLTLIRTLRLIDVLLPLLPDVQELPLVEMRRGFELRRHLLFEKREHNASDDSIKGL